MTAIITADIINSSKSSVDEWMPIIKNTLNQYGQSPLNWEIYRGDSLQLEIEPEKALWAAIHLKATIKQIKGIDIRIGIGIGEKAYSNPKITASNGSAFVAAGMAFDNLKKQTLTIITSDPQNTETLNIMLNLGTITWNAWQPTTALIIKNAIENPSLNQKVLSEILKIKQSNISRGLKRAGFEEIKKKTK